MSIRRRSIAYSALKASLTTVDAATQANGGGGSGQTTFTFSGINLGTAVADRQIYVGITAQAFGNDGDPVGTVAMTVRGVSATRVRHLTDGLGARNFSDLFVASVPSGTSGTIVATLAQKFQTAVSIGVWSVSNLNVPTPVIASDGINNTTAAAKAISDGNCQILVWGTSNGNYPSGSPTLSLDQVVNRTHGGMNQAWFVVGDSNGIISTPTTIHLMNSLGSSWDGLIIAAFR